MAGGAIEYPVRTPPLYWVVVGAFVAIGAVGVGLIAFILSRGIDGTLLALSALIVVTPALYLRFTREYRANGAIVLRPGSITVPDFRGPPRTFDAKTVRLTVVRVYVRFTLMGVGVGDLARGKVLHLVDGGAQRRISTLTLVDVDQSDALLADLERVLRGEAPRGPVHVDLGGSPPAAPDHYRDQLERELQALD